MIQAGVYEYPASSSSNNYYDINAPYMQDPHSNVLLPLPQNLQSMQPLPLQPLQPLTMQQLAPLPMQTLQNQLHVQQQTSIPNNNLQTLQQNNVYNTMVCILKFFFSLSNISFFLLLLLF